MSLDSNQITAKNFKAFYEAIRPYLGGHSKGKLTFVGEVKAFFSETAPNGFLACDGSTYNKADYPQLANLLLSLTDHSAYEVSGDTTKFKVPDLRGEFLRGTGTNSHTNQGSGANVGVHQDATEHMEVYSYNNDSIGIFGQGDYSVKANEDSQISHASTNQSVATTNQGTTTVGRYTSRPTNTSVLFCIAYQDTMIDIDFFSCGGERFAKSDMYDTTEHVIGKWIDGKPLYQKTFNFQTPVSFVAGDWSNIVAVSDIDSLIHSSVLSSSMCEIMEWVVYENGYVRIFSKNTANNVKYLTIVYTKTTDTADSFKYANPTDYSTTEKIVGRWIDGKPLYQKTITVASATIGSYVNFDIDTTTLLDNANISVKDLKGGYYADKGSNTQQFYAWGNITKFGNEDYGYNTHYRQADSVIRVNGTWGNLQYTINDLIFTIQYTKTTD